MGKMEEVDYVCALCGAAIEPDDIAEHLEKTHPMVYKQETSEQKAAVRRVFSILWPFLVVLGVGLAVSVHFRNLVVLSRPESSYSS